jgi:hypothetical protein
MTPEDMKFLACLISARCTVAQMQKVSEDLHLTKEEKVKRIKQIAKEGREAFEKISENKAPF